MYIHVHTTRNAHLKQHNIISGTSVPNLPYVKKELEINLYIKLNIFLFSENILFITSEMVTISAEN